MGSEYVAQSIPLSFALGLTSKTISVVIKGDKVVLSSAVRAILARGTAIGTITNDDTSSNTAGFDPSTASS